MGAGQSSVTTVEDFKNYVYGTAVLMLSSQLDSELVFKSLTEITDEDKHTLPLVTSGTGLSEAEQFAACTTPGTGQYYGDGKEDAIDKYVTAHILDSQDHMTTFARMLVAQLRNRKQQVLPLPAQVSLAPAPDLAPDQAPDLAAPVVPVTHVAPAAPVTPAAPVPPVSTPDPVLVPAPALDSFPVEREHEHEPVLAPAPAAQPGTYGTSGTGHRLLRRKLQAVNSAINEQSAMANIHRFVSEQ